VTEQARASAARLPFDGVRVIDLSHAGAGPFATLQLGDLGAEIIKIERPKHGDGSRFFGQRTGSNEASDYFLSLNRNKASVVVDFSRPEGSALVRRLVEDADVVIENFRPGVLARHALDFASLIDVNPTLIYCSISAFGPTGPWIERGGNDITIQGLSGLMAGTGAADGTIAKIGAPICDLTAGLYAAFAISAAIAAREKNPGPQLIEIPMLDAAISLMTSYVPSVAAGAPAPVPYGTGHAQIVPYQAFLCSDDQYVIVGAFSNGFWRQLCSLIGRPDLAEQPEFRSNPDRVANRDLLIPVLEEIFRGRPRADWIDALGQTSIPFSPVLTIAEAMVSEQAVHNETVYQVGSGSRAAHVTRNPVRNSAWGRRDDSPPPRLGEHTRFVLGKQLGMDDDSIGSLIAAGIVECSDGE
jgi:crotonobetainyl-CoA:carnitine CoA-transferase CaiB-like acyl-CoA transferase